MNADSNHAFSDEFLDTMRYFIQDKDAIRVSRNLRLVFFDYLRFQTSGLHVDFDAILNDVEAMMDLLDAISYESKSWRDKLE
jgi:hypothetical protein